MLLLMAVGGVAANATVDANMTKDPVLLGTVSMVLIFKFYHSMTPPHNAVLRKSCSFHAFL